MLNATPYHHLARTAENRWWRTVLGTIFVIAAWVGLGLGLYGAVTITAELIGLPENADGAASYGALADLALDFLVIAPLWPAVLLAALWIQRRPFGTVSSVAGRLRWGWLWRCTGVAAVAVVLLLLAFMAMDGVEATGADLTGTGGELVGWWSFATSMLVLAMVVPLQSAAEEYLTRGWLLQAVGSWVRAPWLPIAVQAVVFSALHGWGTPWGFADLVVFGLVAGWLTVRTGGLEAAIALHVCNNLLSAVLAAAYGELTVDETAADLPWQAALADMVMLVAYGAAVHWLARRRNPARAAPVMVAGAGSEVSVGAAPSARP